MEREMSLVVAPKLTPLLMVQRSIAKKEAELARLREKERIAQRWRMDDLIYDTIRRTIY